MTDDKPLGWVCHWCSELSLTRTGLFSEDDFTGEMVFTCVDCIDRGLPGVAEEDS